MGYAAQESGEGATRTTAANKGGDKEQAARSKNDGPLCAVARLCGDFDGRLGMYRCARKKVAERNSKYHKRGDVYDDDCEVDGDIFYEIVTKQLFPDIYEKMADFDVVFVQMDGASSHVKCKADLELAGKKRKRIDRKQMPLSKFVLQLANSPDTNLNDLYFFRSLSKFVQARYRLGFKTIVFHDLRISPSTTQVKVLGRACARDGGCVSTGGSRRSDHVTLRCQLDRRNAVYASRISALDAEKTRIPDDS